MLYTNLPPQSDRLFLPSATPSPDTGESRKLRRNSLVGNSVSSGQLPFAEVLFFQLGRADNTTDQPDGETDLGRNQDGLTTRLLRYDSRSRQSAASHSPYPVANLHRFNRAFDIYIRDINLSKCNVQVQICLVS